MILEDALEFIAAVSPAFQLGNQTFLDLVLWRSTVQSVKTYTTQDLSTKAVSFQFINIFQTFNFCIKK